MAIEDNKVLELFGTSILAELERKMSNRTRFALESPPMPIDGEMPTE